MSRRNLITKIDSVDSEDLISEQMATGDVADGEVTMIDSVDPPDDQINGAAEGDDYVREREVSAEVHSSTPNDENISTVAPPSYDAVIAAQSNTVVRIPADRTSNISSNEVVLDVPAGLNSQQRDNSGHIAIHEEEIQQAPITESNIHTSDAAESQTDTDGIRIRSSNENRGSHDQTTATATTLGLSDVDVRMYRSSFRAISKVIKGRSAFAQCGCIFAKGIRDICSRCTCKVNICCLTLDNADDIYSDLLDKAWESGWVGFLALLLPVFHPIIRILSALFGLLVSAFGLSMSIWSITIKPIFPLKIISLVLIGAIFLFNIFDMLTLLWSIATSKNKCRNLNQRRKEEGACVKCFDVGRILLIEILLYPLLICDLFTLFIGRSTNEDSIVDNNSKIRMVTFKVLFGYSCVSRFFYAYLLRLVILVYLPTEALATSRQRVEEIALVLDKEKLEAALLSISGRSLGSKTSYSFQNVFCYLWCICYSILLVSFFVLSVISNAPITFYVVYLFLSVAANFCPIALSGISIVVVVSTSISYTHHLCKKLIK